MWICVYIWLAVCVLCAYSSLRGQRRALNLLEQEIQAVMDHPPTVSEWGKEPENSKEQHVLLTAQPSFRLPSLSFLTNVAPELQNTWNKHLQYSILFIHIQIPAGSQTPQRAS